MWSRLYVHREVSLVLPVGHNVPTCVRLLTPDWDSCLAWSQSIRSLAEKTHARPHKCPPRCVQRTNPRTDGVAFFMGWLPRRIQFRTRTIPSIILGNSRDLTCRGSRSSYKCYCRLCRSCDLVDSVLTFASALPFFLSCLYCPWTSNLWLYPPYLCLLNQQSLVVFTLFISLNQQSLVVSTLLASLKQQSLGGRERKKLFQKKERRERKNTYWTRKREKPTDKARRKNLLTKRGLKKKKKLTKRGRRKHCWQREEDENPAVKREREKKNLLTNREKEKDNQPREKKDKYWPREEKKKKPTDHERRKNTHWQKWTHDNIVCMHSCNDSKRSNTLNVSHRLWSIFEMTLANLLTDHRLSGLPIHARTRHYQNKLWTYFWQFSYGCQFFFFELIIINAWNWYVVQLFSGFVRQFALSVHSFLGMTFHVIGPRRDTQIFRAW